MRKELEGAEQRLLTRGCTQLTCSDDLKYTWRPLAAHIVSAPARESAVVHVAGGRVIERGRGAFGVKARGGDVARLAGAVERPVEGHDGRVGVHVAAQLHRLLLQGAVQLLAVPATRRRVCQDKTLP